MNKLQTAISEGGLTYTDPESNRSRLYREVPRLALWVLASCLGVVVVVTVLRCWRSWSNEAYLHHMAGAWMTMAADLRSGMFYRPLFSQIGYGGTRYFPLHFVVHAALIQTGLSIRAAGHSLEVISMILLLAGTYLLLRNLGVPVWLALSALGAILSTGSAQRALLSIRGDVLPAAMNILGLALCARQMPNTRRVIGASIFFTLAFAAKVTALSGLITAVLVLLLSGQSKTAMKLIGFVIVGFTSVILAIQIASHERFLHILRACAEGGMLTTRNALLAPVHLVILASGQSMPFFHFEYGQTPADLVLLILGLVALVNWPFESKEVTAPLYLISNLAVTTIILATPGTNSNHLLDLEVAAIVMFVAFSVQGNYRKYLSFNVWLLAMVVLLSIPTLLQLFLHNDNFPRLQQFETVVRLVEKTRKPILAEDPVIPLLAGQSPFVLDPNMVEVIQEKDPTFIQPLLKKLKDKSFSAVVLFRDPQTKDGQFWYSTTHFGPGFVEQLSSHYYLFAVQDEQFVYLPKLK